MTEDNGARENRIDKLFTIMIKQNASDLHLKNDQPPILRISGQLQTLKSDPLTDRQIQKLVYEVLSPQQQAVFEDIGSLDLSYEFADKQRVRMNVFRQRGHVSLAARRVHSNIPTFKELYLPEQLADIASFNTGLVLVCGPTGCGKSTTLAAMLEYINGNRRLHILTIEDPIEYSHRDRKSFINQREVGLDVPSWDSALKYMVREDPNVILIGEMRDPNTIHAGMAASETGHLVMGTLHSRDVPQTVSRILEMFPAERHHVIREGLAQNLRAIIVQMLLPAAVEGVRVVPALEILMVNPLARQLIRRGEENKLGDLVRANTSDGSQAMVQAIADLVNKDLVLRKVALRLAPNREQLEMALRGISVDSGRIIG